MERRETHLQDLYAIAGAGEEKRPARLAGMIECVGDMAPQDLCELKRNLRLLEDIHERRYRFWPEKQAGHLERGLELLHGKPQAAEPIFIKLFY